MKLLWTAFKALWAVTRHPLDQEFVNELVVHEQSRHYQRHYGIGSGPHGLPPGKYLRPGMEPFGSKKTPGSNW
jgi:hypothetical protein